MSKQINWGKSPSASGGPSLAVADRLVAGKGGIMKRLTIDIPLDLHQRVKAACAGKGAKMADVVRSMLEKEFAAKS